MPSGGGAAARSMRRGTRRAPSSLAFLFAAIGFQFVVWAASYIGSFLGALGLDPRGRGGGVPHLHDPGGFDRRNTRHACALSIRTSRSFRADCVADTRARLLRDLVRRRTDGITVSFDSRSACDLELRKRRSARDRAGVSRLSVCQAVRRRRVSRLLVRERPRSTAGRKSRWLDDDARFPVASLQGGNMF